MSCQICNQNYDSSQVILPCLHGFCRKCFSGDKCPVCQQPHKNQLQKVRNFFPIPSILKVLKFLGFDFVPLCKAENVVYLDPIKCDGCHDGLYGLPYECLDLKYGINIIRSLCSRCSSFSYTAETNKIDGNAEIFLERLETNSKEQRIIDNYQLINHYYGLDISDAAEMTNVLFSRLGINDILLPEDCNRVLQIINDCQPPNAHWSAENKFYRNQIAKKIASHCLEWHKVPQCEYFLKHFKGRAFGYAFDGPVRKLNIYLIAYFIYFLRTNVMIDIDWFASEYPDASTYLCEAILQK